MMCINKKISYNLVRTGSIEKIVAVNARAMTAMIPKFQYDWL